MSYEILSAYADCSEFSYEDWQTSITYPSEILEKAYVEMANAGIKLAGMTPGDWIYNTNSDLSGEVTKIKVARYATLEDIPFKFIARGRLGGIRRVELAIEYNKTNIDFMYFINIYPTQDKVPFGGVSEKIIDIDGGIHFSSIDVKYDGSGTNKRIFSTYITKIYELNTDKLFGWVFRGGKNGMLNKYTIIKESTGEYYQQESNIKDATRMRYDMFQSNEHIIDHNQLVLSTKVINDKYYTLGNGESVTQYDQMACLFTEKDNEESQNQNTEIQNKIKLSNFYEGKDLYIVKTPISTISYTKDN